jgi:hypothetical protein
VLFVSHNMSSIRKLCKRGLLFSKGQLQLDGETEITIDYYLSEGQKNLSPVIELAEPNTQNYGIPLGRGTKLSFYNMEGVPQAEFKLWEPWVISFDFEIYRSLKHVIAGVGISTLQEVSLVTYWSQPDALASGKYRVEFICRIPLKACELTFTVGLSENERTFFYLQNQGFVSICEVSINEQPLKSRGAGLLLNDNQVKIQCISEI